MSENYFPRRFINLINALFPLRWIVIWFKFRVLGYNSICKQGKERKHQPAATLVCERTFTFGESPRIRNGALYFADFHGNAVYKVNLETGEIEAKIEFPEKVSGIGWLPNSDTMLVVQVESHTIASVTNCKTVRHYASLSPYAKYWSNDMVLDAFGNAFVGSCGFDCDKIWNACEVPLVGVLSSSVKSIPLMTNMFFPNGMVITPDQSTLLVAETMAGVITAFTISYDQKIPTLSNRRLWANIGAPVDGMCLDAAGCIWVCIPQVGAYNTSGAVIRVEIGGNVKTVLGFEQHNFCGKLIACNLTSVNDKNYLYVVESDIISESLIKPCYNSRVKRIEVEVGPALIHDNPNYNAGYF